MKRLILSVLIVAIVSLSGCTWYDALFNIFGDEHYTGGSGTTWHERKVEYDGQVRAWGGEP
jgi:hypothetical protein